jgi:hypothetical protein
VDETDELEEEDDELSISLFVSLLSANTVPIVETIKIKIKIPEITDFFNFISRAGW